MKDTDFYLFFTTVAFLAKSRPVHAHQGIVYSRLPRAARKAFAGAEVLGFLITVLWFIRKETVSR